MHRAWQLARSFAGPARQGLRAVGGWLFPGVCILCHGPCGRGLLCDSCLFELPRARRACPRCAHPVLNAGYCLRCRRLPPPYTHTICPYLYLPPVPHLVHRLKFQADLAVASTLGPVLAGVAVRHEAGLPDLLVPVPLHPTRLRARGFNQAELVARAAGRVAGVPVAPALGHRARPTVPQTDLGSRSERRRNQRGAFEAGGAAAGRRIAIVDDVVTTGATCGALALALLGAGAAEVCVWALARAPEIRLG